MELRRDDLAYPELSYQIVGILFDVYRELGAEQPEKQYQRAVALSLRANNLSFKEQVCVPMKYKDAFIGRYFLDFLIEEKVVLELKRGNRFPHSGITQIYSYLQMTNLSLGVLATFTASGVQYKRILNIH